MALLFWLRLKHAFVYLQVLVTMTLIYNRTGEGYRKTIELK